VVTGWLDTPKPKGGFDRSGGGRFRAGPPAPAEPSPHPWRPAGPRRPRRNPGGARSVQRAAGCRGSPRPQGEVPGPGQRLSRGRSPEGFALEQVLQAVSPPEAYFWATHGEAEVDLFFIVNGRRYGVEMKYAEAPRSTTSGWSTPASTRTRRTRRSLS